MKYVNLTPHEVVIMDDKKEVVRRVPKSGLQARLDTERGLFSIAEDGVMFFDVIFGKPILLDEDGQIALDTNKKPVAFPEQTQNTILIVSAKFLDGMSRGDLWSPGELVRDKKGVPIGCIGLNQVDRLQNLTVTLPEN